MRTVLAVDGGNSKTFAAVADESGAVLAVARAGGSNYQSVGRKAAAAALSGAVGSALSGAGLRRVDVACYGLAGVDRDKDLAVFRELLGPIDPGRETVLVNDTLLALRAGTADGVGVALIGGAGSNCIGTDRAGRIKRAGGLGPLSGDKANAGALAQDAIIAAIKGSDGRGPRTALEAKLKAALRLEAIEDAIEFDFVESQHDLIGLGELAPLVFEAAGEGDPVALAILREHGAAAAEAALAVLRGLFDPAAEVVLALGGSVYQKGRHPALIDAIRERVRAEFPRVRLVVLEGHPLLGAVLMGYDRLGLKSDGEHQARLTRDLMARLTPGLGPERL